MTIIEYILSKLSKFGLEFTEAELLADLLAVDVDGQKEISSGDDTLSAKLGLYKMIPELLLNADVTEGGYSIKINRDGILSYFNLLCDELGLQNPLNRQPEVTDMSDLW